MPTKENEISLRDIKLSDEEKKKLAILGVGVLVIFALAIYIFNALFNPGISYPGNCGSQQSYYQVSNCITQLAASSGNVFVCSYLYGGPQSYCVYAVAAKEQNATVCAYINKADPEYSSCVLSLNKKQNNIALCNALPAQYATQCIYNVSAHFNFSTQLCSGLSNGSYRSECLNLNYYRTALNTGAKLYCGYVQSGQSPSALALLNYNPSTMNQTFLVENLFTLATYNITPQAYCYYRLAIKEDNSTICSSISGPVSTQCSDYVLSLDLSKVNPNFSASNMTAACSSYSGPEAAVCMYDYALKSAIKARSAAPCMQLFNYSRDECTLYVALNTSNYTYCQNIANSSLQTFCLYVKNLTANGKATVTSSP